MMLELSTLNGGSLTIRTSPQSTVKHLKQLISAELDGMHPGLLRILNAEGDVDASSPVFTLRDQALTILFRGRQCLPFHERKVAENSLVLVDDIPAIFSYYSPGGWSSSKIRFQFNQGEMHPDFKSSFQTKDWITDPRGIVHTRGGHKLHVLQIVQNEEPSMWQVMAASALVRAEKLLDSEQLGRLSRDDLLTVEEGCFLDDTDCTPRLRISSPLTGWVTPYLTSSDAVLIMPSQEVMERCNTAENPLGKIIQMMAKRAGSCP
eukprot:TRINITY_DN9424_c0_g1_i1.p1 TRINITY_DN9424_c0_g1~~TRINITY_DN9424_c0_g1_i1.p1  ORF type:complete len:263 (-),score=41.61 TRINITY_DN9424_c0_g1_i1:296-1084(-)